MAFPSLDDTDRSGWLRWPPGETIRGPSNRWACLDHDRAIEIIVRTRNDSQKHFGPGRPVHVEQVRLLRTGRTV